MKRDEKIEKINAYKKIIETKKLPLKTVLDKDRTVESDILEEFTVWAESQLSKLLGEDVDTDTEFLTEEEKLVLKAYVQRLIKKMNDVPLAANSRTPVKRPTIEPEQPAQRSISSLNARPLIEPGRLVKKAETGTADLIEQEEEDADANQPLGNRLRSRRGQTMEERLDEMDRRAPKY